MATPSYPRTTCVVPGCTRWSTKFPNEWLCAQHWRLVDTSLKRFRTRLLRRRKAQGWKRYGRADMVVWHRMRRQAILRAAGL